MTKNQMPEIIEVKKLTLEQGDFIEWILQHTNDKTGEFRVYETQHHILVGIDKKSWLSQQEDDGSPD